MQHLYVMQNHLGLIKIGRSANAELRRRRLEVADVCEIKIIRIFEDKGNKEAKIHSRLSWYRAFGEWYYGDEIARWEISKCTGLPRNVEWPYPLADDDAIDNWLERLERRRDLESADKMLQRIITNMARGTDDTKDYRDLDAQIWMRLTRFEHREHVIYFVEEGPNGEAVYVCYDPVTRERQIVPFFTTDLQAALSLWPDEQQPSRWDGTIWECCVGGLRARKASIKARHSV